MLGSHRNLALYIASQKKLLEFAPKIETIIPCHHPYPIDPSYIQKNLNDAVRLKNRQLQGQSHPSLPCFSYQGQWTEFYYME